MEYSVTFQCEKPGKIIKWKVKPGSFVNTSTILCLYESDKTNKVEKLRCQRVGTVSEVKVEAGQAIQPGDELVTIERCSHPTVMKDMCAECGADLRQECGLPGDRRTSSSASVAMVHSVPELIVSQSEAQELGRADEQRLLGSRKLVLLVDLDQTLLHTTNDAVPPNLKGAYHFQLWHGRSLLWYHTKFRPGMAEFLENISQLFELHICTFGVRMYAHIVTGFLDPEGKFFSHRILSRDECFNPTSKTANLKALFPCGDSMVCIIDDREDVWSYAPNLIHVSPYIFFDGTADINAPQGLDKETWEGDENDKNSKPTPSKKPRKQVRIVRVPKKKTPGAKFAEGKGKNYSVYSGKRTVDVADEEKASEQTDDSAENKPGTNKGGIPEVNQRLDAGSCDKDGESEEKDTSLSGEKTCSEPVTSGDMLDTKSENVGEGKTDQLMTEGTVIGHADVNEKDDEIYHAFCGEADDLYLSDDSDKDSDCGDDDKSHGDGKDGKKTTEAGEQDGKDKITDAKAKKDETMQDETKDDKADIKEDKDETKDDKDETKDDKDETKDDKDETKDDKDETKDDADETKDDDEEYDEQIEWEDTDDYLIYLQDVLTRIHKTYFQFYDEKLMKATEPSSVRPPDIKTIIPYVKKKVLKGANIVFSGVFPNNKPLEKSRAYIVAKSLGANIGTNLVYEDNGSGKTTHLVAGRDNTEKVHEAKRKKGIHIVNPDWLWTCAYRWEWVDERLYQNLTVVTEKEAKDSPLAKVKPTNKVEKKVSGSNDDSGAGDAERKGKIEERRFSDSYNPLYSFSKDDLDAMDKEAGDLTDDDEDDDDEESDGEDSKIEEEIRQRVLGFNKCLPDPSSDEDSLSADFPKGWSDLKRKRVNHDEDTKDSVEDDVDEDERNSKMIKLESDGSDSDDGSFGDSVGSVDEEMAAAVEKELLRF